MCGRYTLTADGKDLWELIEGTFPPALLGTLDLEKIQQNLDIPDRRKYNIVPCSYEPILLLENGKLSIKTAHWWIASPWAENQIRWRISAKREKSFSWSGTPKSHFNSRWDTVTNPNNSNWYELLAQKRCLVPASGFIEWADEKLLQKGQAKIPKYFFLKEKRLFFFAGIFALVNDDEGKPFLSYNLITGEPNAMLSALPHHRMPAILKGMAASRWINQSTNAEEAAALLGPTPDNDMDGYYLSKLVNSPRNESQDVLTPLNLK